MISKAFRMLMLVISMAASSLTLAQSITTPQSPYTPGDNSAHSSPEVAAAYRNAIAQSFISSRFIEGQLSFVPGMTVKVTFSDGAEESFVVSLNGTVYSVSPVANTYKPKPASVILSDVGCAGGAAMIYGTNGHAFPLYRATYECDASICRLVSAVVIGFIGLPYTSDQVADSGGFCQAII